MGRRWLIGVVVVAGVVWGLPAPTAPARAAGDPVLIGAGDIATCGGSNDTKTAALVESSGGIPFTVGDNAYDGGTASEFNSCYDPTWGAFKTETRPALGDNEYLTAGAAGYFDYFGAAGGARTQGWYSYDVGTWHVVVLNSNCSQIGGCASGSSQEQWLKADLAAAGGRCIAAIWHEPRFSSVYGNSSKTKPFWDDLHAAGADIVLNGHHHAYERFAPQDPSGKADPAGIREFIVGTGGASLASGFNAVQPNSEVRNNKTHGVLKLTLHASGYDFEFVAVSGSSFRDSGSGSCNPAGDNPGGGGPPPPAGDVTLTPVADARVQSGHASTNYGRSSTLAADRSPDTASFLRFDVKGVGAVSKATLRLFVTNGSANGPQVYPIESGWSERSVTWNKRPRRTGPMLADVGSISKGKWVEYDVSAGVTGDGSWSFELAGDSSDDAKFRSREASSNRPQLVLVPAPAPPAPAPPPPPPPPPEEPPAGPDPAANA